MRVREALFNCFNLVANIEASDENILCSGGRLTTDPYRTTVLVRNFNTSGMLLCLTSVDYYTRPSRILIYSGSMAGDLNGLAMICSLERTVAMMLIMEVAKTR